jgi:hypothetical protein
LGNRYTLHSNNFWPHELRPKVAAIVEWESEGAALHVHPFVSSRLLLYRHYYYYYYYYYYFYYYYYYYYYYYCYYYYYYYYYYN